MIRKDYILRWAEELARVLAQLMGKDPKLQLEEIDQLYHSLPNFDLREIEEKEGNELIHYLVKEKKMPLEQMTFLAYLLAKAGENYFELEEWSQSKDQLQNALTIFEYIEEHNPIYSLQQVQQIESIKTKLNQLGNHHSD